ncbi:MAG: hypothetical protein IT435_16100 [Phycisphaerales bacterium]|nr:hypothetical protein [Phycisphaerales bacterium]
MTTKQISFAIRAQDLATGTVKSVTGAIKGMLALPVKGFASGMKSLFSFPALVAGAVTAGALHNIHEAAKTADQIGKLAKRLDTPVETMSALKYVADQGDVEFESFAKKITVAAKNASIFARTGGGPAADAFKKMGGQAEALARRGAPIEQLLPAIALGLSNIADEGERIELADSIFGKGGGQEFLDMLNDGGNLIDTMSGKMAEARKLGVVFTKEQTDLLGDYGDAIDRIGEAWLGVRVKLLSAVAPYLIRFADWMSSALAVTPEIASNVAQSIRLAFGDRGQAGAEAREAWENLGQEALNVTKATLRGVGRIAIAGVPVIMDAVGRIGEGRLGIWGKSWIKSVWLYANSASADWLTATADLLPDAMRKKALDEIRQWGATERKEMKAIEDERHQALTAMGSDTSWFTLSSTDWPEFGKIASDTAKEVGVAGQSFFQAADKVAGYSKAQAAAGEGAQQTAEQIEHLTGTIRQLDAAMPESEKRWKSFTGGMQTGFKTLTDEANDFAGTGQRVVEDSVHSLSNGLGSALVESEGNLKRFGKAAISVLGDTAKAVSTAIFQFLILRAITSGIGALFASGPSVGPMGKLDGGAIGVGGSVDYGVLADGGYIGKGGRIYRFAAGGSVPGATTNRDSVPALLMPGERVLSREEVRDQARRSVSGAPSITINQTINVQSTGGKFERQSVQQITRATLEALLAGLSANPAGRSRLKAMLA